MRSNLPKATLGLILAFAACDEAKPSEKGDAVAGNEAAYQAQGHVDLQAVVTLVESGEVASATELEARLNAEDGAVARVDLDEDGKPDRLRIVEKRAEKQTTFEIHAVPSSRAEAEAELELTAAPTVASLELVADADADAVTARASFSASFSASLSTSASAKAEASGSASVERTLGGITADAEGRLVLDAEASAFVAWVFEPARPTYVAKVFVAKAEPAPEPDPCWPPGHCKHGLWKARGELPPGQQERGHGHAGEVAHAKVPSSDAARHEISHASKKSSKSEPAPDKASKSSAKDKGKSSGSSKPKASAKGDAKKSAGKGKGKG